MKEIWKSVVNYVGYYEVSNLGNVRSVERKIICKDGRIINYKSKLLKPAKNKYGYLQVGLSVNCKTNSYYVHQLVAQAFIPNTYNKPTVNHKNGNKLNNYFFNLEWATKSEQAIHSLKNNLREMPNAWVGKFGSKHGAAKKVLQYTIDDIFIEEHNSIIEACKKLNISSSGISGVLKGRKNTTGGFKWKYKT